jgi:hypothetical protein
LLPNKSPAKPRRPEPEEEEEEETDDEEEPPARAANIAAPPGSCVSDGMTLVIDLNSTGIKRTTTVLANIAYPAIFATNRRRSHRLQSLETVVDPYCIGDVAVPFSDKPSSNWSNTSPLCTAMARKGSGINESPDAASTSG